MTTILLGPQRFRTTAGTVVRSLGVTGPVATVSAGWQDRERDDSELDEVLEGQSHNLGLFHRLTDVLDTDPEFAEAGLAHRDAVDELAGIYSFRLQHALESVYAVQRRSARADLVEVAFRDGIAEVRAIDSWYLATLDQLYGELGAAVEQSEPVQRHRAEVAEILGSAGALVITGGHVGVLLRCLKLFDVTPPAELPVVAWSAGAMALTDRVVLYNDRGPRGVVGSELWDRGMRRARGIVAMPHARRRLRIDDPMVLRVLVHRFADARCLLLDDGARVDLGPQGELPAGARVICDDGTITTVGELP